MNSILIAAVAAGFILLAFLLNKKNARYLLAGYNTLSREDQSRFDLDGFLRFFRRFHLFLASSVLIMGYSIDYFTGGIQLFGYLAVYILLSYLFFLIRANRYSVPEMRKRNHAGIFMLGVSVVMVIILMIATQ